MKQSKIAPRIQDRGSDILDQVDYRLAQTTEEKEDIYRLRYRAYLREGAIRPSDDQRVTDQYDDLPNSWTFGVYLQDELYSSLRISVLTSEWRESCSADTFGDIVLPKLDLGQVIIDPSRFVADPNKPVRFPELPYLTVRLACMACGYFNADLGLAGVRAEHQAFYRRVFQCETIAEPRWFPGLLKPVGLMAADYSVVRERIFERYPMMRSTSFERRMLFERSSSTMEALEQPLADLREQLRDSLRNDPELGLCLKILDHVTRPDSHRLGSLNFSTLSKIVGKTQVDSDLLRALTILTTSDRAILEARGKYVDDAGMEYQIAPQTLSKTLRSGKFVHPKTGQSIHDFEGKLILYFVPSSSLLKLSRSAKLAANTDVVMPL